MYLSMYPCEAKKKNTVTYFADDFDYHKKTFSYSFKFFTREKERIIQLRCF